MPLLYPLFSIFSPRAPFTLTGPIGRAGLLVVTTLGLLGGGCAQTRSSITRPGTSTSPSPDTRTAAALADGRSYDPQVVIRADDPARVRAVAINLVQQYGGNLLQAGPDQLLFSKAGGPGDPSLLALGLGDAGTLAPPVYLVRLTLTPVAAGLVRVSAAGYVGGQAASFGPRPTEVSSARARTLMMAGLLRLKAAVEATN